MSKHDEMNEKNNQPKVKLHVQLEHFNNLKYDFIEVETPIRKIPMIYTALKTIFKGEKGEIKQNFVSHNVSTPQAPKNDWNKPSQAQISFARKLGITNPEGMTKQEVSQAINHKLGK